MTFLRRYEQFIQTPGWTEIEPPRDFAERAYAAGLEPGSGVVKFYAEKGYVRATLDGRVRGSRVHLRVLGEDDQRACRRLLDEIRRLA